MGAPCSHHMRDMHVLSDILRVLFCACEVGGTLCESNTDFLFDQCDMFSHGNSDKWIHLYVSSQGY